MTLTADMPPAAAVPLASCEIESPLGRIRISAGEAGVCAVAFMDGAERAWLRAMEAAPKPGPAARAHAALASAQLVEYFAGRRREFDVPLDPRGTGFEQAAWAQLLRIPFGATISYGEQARRLGDGGAARGVGRANGRNPISIIVPCHRVVGADGSLTGYGGGVERKRWLLSFERDAACRSERLFS